jgi:iron complex outermembrane recepter protein
MRKTTTFLSKCTLILLTFFASTALIAQTKITGKIKDGGTSETLAGVNITVKGKVIGTTTDANGNFSLTTNTPTPFTISVSFVGYQTEEIDISSDKVLNISMKEQAIMGQEIVVSASRVEESVLKSPVSVEKMDIRAIKETPSSSFYDGLSNIKGIDMTTQGLLFKSINMRGFGATGNPRTVQMIDGMDNQAPGLNFPVDNIVGMPELDVESVEILPGAASALYGPNAINGLILMNSKSPFLYQGLSAAVKTGIMSADNRAVKNTPFYDASVRWAKAWNNKFALKLNFAYLSAKDWEATNTDNLNSSNKVPGGIENGSRGAGVNYDYDGINVYGDEVQANMLTVANALVAAKIIPSAATGLVPSIPVSRTGFLERDLADYDTKSFKFNGAMHYRLTEKLELIGQLNYGSGTTMYTGTGRYSLRNFAMTQAKIELKGDALTLRAYTTQERSGESYFTGLQAVSMLNSIKPHETWFGEYVGAFVQARSGGAAEAAAHGIARGVADKGMPTVGTQAFETLKEKFASKTIVDGGGAFLDKTNLYHLEGIYNFKNKVKFIELLAGANLRKFILKSGGTLFADKKDGRDGTIPITEFGAFLQASKTLFDDKFKLTASLRFDKNENFDGQFSPRVSGVYSFGQSNIRLSYQTGFRIPTTQNQYIDLETPGKRFLIGGLPEFDKRYNLANGIALTDLATANIAKYASDPATIAQAQAYATAAVTAQATPLITAGVTAAITDAVTKAVTVGITDAVTKAVTAGITQQVTAGVTAAITQQVTAGVTSAITTQVTSVVTAQVEAMVTAGTLAAENAAAAIAAGVATNLPLALAANLEAGVAAALPGALSANLQPTVDVQLPLALAANLQPEVNKALPAALEANLAPGVAANLPAALAANFQPAFNAELAKALASAVPGVTGQVLPAFALAKIPKYKARPLRPERIQSWEIGYKGIISKRLFFDAYYYESKYKEFIGGVVVVVPIAAAGPGLPIESGAGGASTRLIYSRPSNTSAEIKVSGWASSLNYSLQKGYNVGFNISNNQLKGFTPTAEQDYAGFNTPKYRYNLSFGKRLGSGEKMGFNVMLRHQDAFVWEASFNQPSTTSVERFTNTEVPKITNLDAQVSFKLPAFKSILKVGGTNIGSKPYFQAYGSALVGSMYYVSLSFDELFNK